MDGWLAWLGPVVDVRWLVRRHVLSEEYLVELAERTPAGYAVPLVATVRESAVAIHGEPNYLK